MELIFFNPATRELVYLSGNSARERRVLAENEYLHVLIDGHAVITASSARWISYGGENI